MKKCTKCQLEQNEGNFYESSKTICKVCFKERGKVYRQNNKEILNERKREHRKLYGRETRRRSDNEYFHNIKSQYGLSKEWYTEQVIKQEGKCAICKKEPKLKKNCQRALCIDHNHNTNKVRELLCSKCNLVIGFALEDTEILQNAIKYLGKHNL